MKSLVVTAAEAAVAECGFMLRESNFNSNGSWGAPVPSVAQDSGTLVLVLAAAAAAAA